MIRVLVTGADGQLGKSIKEISETYPQLRLEYKNSKEFDITDASQTNELFASKNYDYCINCAAYTNVEQSEKDLEKAYSVNAEGVANLVGACLENNVVLIHISTDYVFDGKKETPYKVSDTPNPINIYGASKLKGESYIIESLKNYFIIRTSWLYSDFGKNFYKTILHKAKTEEVLRITDDQTGCPTHAGNLAKYILELITSRNKSFGLYHFTDEQAMTWYGFAEKILSENGLEHNVRLEKAKNYRTFAQRPKNSVLATNTSNL